MRLYDPFDLMRPSLEIAEIFTEAQVVIGLRLAGFAGLWPMAQTEAEEMLAEKLQAAHCASQAALRAVMVGAGACDIVMAALASLRQRTRANAQRLAQAVAEL